MKYAKMIIICGFIAVNMLLMGTNNTSFRFQEPLSQVAMRFRKTNRKICKHEKAWLQNACKRVKDFENSPIILSTTSQNECLVDAYMCAWWARIVHMELKNTFGAKYLLSSSLKKHNYEMLAGLNELDATYTRILNNYFNQHTRARKIAYQDLFITLEDEVSADKWWSDDKKICVPASIDRSNVFWRDIKLHSIWRWIRCNNDGFINFYHCAKGPFRFLKRLHDFEMKTRNG